MLKVTMFITYHILTVAGYQFLFCYMCTKLILFLSENIITNKSLKAMYYSLKKDKIYQYNKQKEKGTDKDTLWTLDKQLHLEQE